ncbi:methylated-DNA--[protein]-cysteine S-methyltransferase [Phaeobacter sp.]|uniref:methylated-DNA--[protein]-cysteine S-methyltransferase n=1 Tax=Phaeobacter sp. TaxID=1902409 RepID=UPI0025DA9698|nr:methylated-DNA--[protein]-cysteine S-methyltransferase [Phaeobacter sp.]
MPELVIDSPVGPLCLTEEGGEITRLTWSRGASDTSEPTDLLQDAAEQLAAYFDKRLQVFDLPMRVHGSAFQRAVCAAMSAVPLGHTTTYGDIARDVGGSAQSVGTACGANPIPILIPCHRVLGANGLGGFSGQGGVETKVQLLRHEGAAGLLI